MMNAKFTKEYQAQRGATAIYKVANTDGMTKEEILDACDRNNWGGDICGDTVYVYID